MNTLLELCTQPKTVVELMVAMNWKNRTKFRQKFITPLLEKGLLRLTIPDKPQSSKQQYQTTEVGMKNII